MKKRYILLIVCLIFLSSSLLLPQNAKGSINIARLTQEAPGLHNYPGSEGVVWYREISYSLTADGRMEKVSTWVILAAKGIDEKWRDWTVPVYPGGAVEVIESALYDPGTSAMLAPVISESGKTGDLEFIQIRFPELQDEYLINLSYREIIPKDCRLDDFVRMDLDLPSWENRINVNIPQGSDLFYSSEGIDPPVIQKQNDATKHYGWVSFNLPSRDRASLAINTRPFIAFSLRHGEDSFARDIQVISSSSLPPVPGSILRFNKEANKIKAGSKIIRFVEEAPDLKGFPGYYVREKIPANPPWSKFEKVILLSKWLSLSDWNTGFYWMTEQPLKAETPGTMGMISMPVLELTPPGGSSVFYQLGQGLSNSDVPPEMWGRSVYSYEEGSLVKRNLPKGEASEHRFNINWVLELSEEGILSGRLEFLVRNGWKSILMQNGDISVDSVAGMFSRLKVPGYDPAKIEISHIKYGSRIRVPVQFNSAIISGNNVLLNIPSISLDQLTELGNLMGSYELKFPFVIDQGFEIHLPEGYGIVALPATSDRDFGNISLKEDFSLNKKKQRISGEIKLLVNADKIDDSIRRPLLECLRGWLLWADKTVPLHKK